MENVSATAAAASSYAASAASASAKSPSPKRAIASGDTSPRTCEDGTGGDTRNDRGPAQRVCAGVVMDTP